MKCPKCSYFGKPVQLNKNGSCPYHGEIMEAHLNNWVYKEARKLTEEVRQEQILKGAAKYPVPLGDADWTPLQLVHHAMQENVDQSHYLTMLMFEIKQLNEKCERQQKEIIRLERLLNP